ncbi:FUSC family protein [uncultured Pseudacidovorax sp.]|uniref:FUSC family protein n=1 Tax=uncultured Pseudacidovorax sp. TaxID=679313 RepID=UPI0025E98FE3|nr:FUSC family protein [uncultured Pseudacidovorax sp.]
MQLSRLLPRFSAAEMIFSAKCFAAAMLAMGVASWAGMPRPFWALMTTYIVANPMAGAVRSKAVFRLLGTLLGCAATLLMVPALVDAPELLTLALALWVALCLFVSLLDRTPRAYLFMLAGYSAAVIGFPAVGAPTGLFDTATARVQEIGLGIVCAGLVHSLVWPVSLAPTLVGMMDRTLADAGAWLRAMMQAPAADAGRPAAPGQQAARRKLAADVSQLRVMATHVPFDTSHLQWTAEAIRALQHEVAALTPFASAVDDRLRALRDADGRLPADVERTVGTVLARLTESGRAGPDLAGRPLPEADAARLRAAARSLGDATSTTDDWTRALRTGLAVRLEELIDAWAACVQLRERIDAGLAGRPQPLAARSARTAAPAARDVLHRDVGMAAWSALAAMVAICLCSAFWILTGWSGGAAMPMMAAIFCSFFASMDDPVPGIYAFLKALLMSLPLGALYVLVLMPLVVDLPTLALVCAPVFLVLGAYLARPATMLRAMGLLLSGVMGTLSLHDTGQADFASFINSNIAQVLGGAAAGVVTALMRSVSAEWSARRIQRRTWRELGRLPRSADDAQARLHAARVLDRIGLLAPRIAQAGGTVAGVNADDALVDLRIGTDLHALQRHAALLPGRLGPEILAQVARLFREHPAQSTTQQAAQAQPQLAERIDEALRALLPAAPATSTDPADAADDRRRVLAALVGLRRNLFPSRPWRLTPIATQEALA